MHYANSSIGSFCRRLYLSNSMCSLAIQCLYFLFSDNLNGFNIEAVLGHGRRRGIKLLLNGYEYYKNGSNLWRCSQYKKSCKARLKAMVINGKMMAKITTNVEHNHPKEVLKINSEIYS